MAIAASMPLCLGLGLGVGFVLEGYGEGVW